MNTPLTRHSPPEAQTAPPRASRAYHRATPANTFWRIRRIQHRINRRIAPAASPVLQLAS